MYCGPFGRMILLSNSITETTVRSEEKRRQIAPGIVALQATPGRRGTCPRTPADGARHAARRIRNGPAARCGTLPYSAPVIRTQQSSPYAQRPAWLRLRAADSTDGFRRRV